MKKPDAFTIVLKVALVTVCLLFASAFVAYHAGAPMFDWLRPEAAANPSSNPTLKPTNVIHSTKDW